MKLILGAKPVAKPDAIPPQDTNAQRAPSLAQALLNQKETDPVKKQTPRLSLKGMLSQGMNKPNADQPATSATSDTIALKNTQPLQLGQNPDAVVQETNSSDLQNNAQQMQRISQTSEKYILDAEATDTLPMKTIEGFQDRMQKLIDCMDSKVLPTALKDLLLYTQANKNLRPILRETDVQLFVRAARQAYGLVVTAKAKNQATRKKSTAAATALVAELGSLDFSL